MRAAEELLRFKVGKTRADVDRVLRHLVRDAGRSVPYYRALFRATGLDTTRFVGADDLARLPQSRRESLAEFPTRGFLREGRDPDRCVRTSTSGSTGQPLTIYMTRPETYFRRYTLLRTIGHYTALRLPLRVADVGPMVPHGRQTVEQRVGLVHLLRIPGNVPLGEQREALLRHRPAIIEGYPTCLEILAERSLESETRRLQPRLVVCRGEVLRQPTRRLLEAAFRCPVANLYSCEEVGNMAWECPDQPGRFHVNSDTCVLEVASDGTPDGKGDVVVTNLYNRTMPFIRYRLGDRATPMDGEVRSCSCGATGLSLVNLAGREDDFVVFPDGRRLPPRVVTNALFNALRLPNDPHRLCPNVRRYQIVQEEDYSIRVSIEWQGPVDPHILDRIASAVKRVAPSLRWRVELADGVHLTPAGKFRMVLSRVRGRPQSCDVWIR